MTVTPQNYADPVVTIDTSMGNISIELFPGQAPITVGNFLNYAYSGFYAGTIFHRVVAGFVDQGGGYTTQYQEKATNPPITLETPNGLSNLAGTIAMARTSDPNSATSQFYINAVNNPFLDYSSPTSPGYAVFGDVIQGMNVVTAINNVAVDSYSVPLTQVVIQSVTTSVYYPGSRADYTISMSGGQLAVTPLSGAPAESSLPSASILAKTNVLQFSDQAVTPASDTVANVTMAFTGGTLTGPADVFDSAANVTASLGTLQSIAAAGKLNAIGLTDSGTPALSFSAAQFTADAAAINDISGLHTVTVQMSGTAAAHNFTGENWTGANALQFSDQTVIVAATPGPANAVTTGNVTELYSAVLAREPDVAGLAFYQNYLKANPNTGLLQFAEWFLSSSEYTSTHYYPQSTAGDTQFIQDSYQNLLHRTPSASEVSFYETNVLAPAVAGQTPGSQAYANAQFQAHAQMLVYFSASKEFLSDVQITAANPASAQHWLLLT